MPAAVQREPDCVRKHLYTFTKSQLVSATGTAADFTLFGVLVKLLDFSPIWSVGISAALGAIIIFFLGRHWVFQAAHGHLVRQAILFIICALVSIGLNTGVLAMLLHVGHGEFMSRIAAAVLVAVTFNFPFQHFVVFGPLTERE